MQTIRLHWDARCGTWIILDGAWRRRLGLVRDQLAGAERALARYVTAKRAGEVSHG